ncbi:MAG: universal stress protein [Planctomycetia bacterium]|nr:universal stress protein [Planctomycetia bacterium]
MDPIHRILCPVDFSEVSSQALAYAERLAAATGAELILVHAFDIPASLTYADIENPSDPNVRKQFEALSLTLPPAKATRVLHAGPPGEVICWLAENRACDLIVMGTHGRSGLMHLLLGSVAEHVVRHARCPVVTVPKRPPGEQPLSEPLVTAPKAPRFM